MARLKLSKSQKNPKLFVGKAHFDDKVTLIPFDGKSQHKIRPKAFGLRQEQQKEGRKEGINLSVVTNFKIHNP